MMQFDTATKASGSCDAALLNVQGLCVSFDTDAGRIRAVEDVGFSLRGNTIMGLVGESGCGKSVTALSVMRLLPVPSGRIEAGRIHYKGTDLLQLPVNEMYRVRGNRISMIFQEPMTALNPVHRIGDQIQEVYDLHFPGMADTEKRLEAVEVLRQVGISDPERRMADYPHQLSGGMRQRVMIAMALACKPDILIADEPTTALDVTIQSQILEEIKALQEKTGMAVLLITHDLGVIAAICDAVVVMYAGKVVESAPVLDLFDRPLHPYTRGLLASIPRLESEPKTPLHIISGMVPELGNMPVGCRFHNRCPHVMGICRQKLPPDVTPEPGRTVACHLYQEIANADPAEP